MLIALLAVLGVDLGLLLLLLAIVVLRRRWVTHRPGAFEGAARVADGAVEGLSPTWRRGYGRWAGHVLVWTTRPFLLRNVLVPVGSAGPPRPAKAGEVERLGETPAVATFEADGEGRLEVATRHDQAPLALGPFARPTASVQPREPVTAG